METFGQAPISDSDTHIEVASGTPSFDDFDRVEAVTKELEEKADKKSKKAAKKSAESEGNDSIPQAKEKVEGDKKEEVQDEAPEEKISEESTEEKSYLDHTGEEVIQVKINGKMEEVKLADLKANYSGKIAYDKKFSEFDKERKQFQTEREKITQPINKFKELLTQGKAGDALLHLVDFVGEDAYTFNNKLITALTPIIQERLSMSPEQIEALDAKREVEHLRKKEQSAFDRSKAEQSRIELNQRVLKLQETHSISDDDFRKAAESFKSRLVADGKFKPEEFTPELVADFHLASKYSTRTFEAIDSVDKNLGDDQKLVSELMNLLFENPTLSKETLVELIREYSGVNDKLKVLTEKSQVGRRVQASNNTPGRTQNRPEFFSDYED